MKKFFKSICYGVRGSYEENREIILFLVEVIVSTFIGYLIWKCFFVSDDALLACMLIVNIIGFFIWGNYLHYTEANSYEKENDVSFEEAWKATKPKDNLSEPF